MVTFQHVPVAAENRQRMQEKVAKIHCVQNLEAMLVKFVQFGALAVGECIRFCFGDLVVSHCLVLPAVHECCHHTGRPTLFVDIFSADQLFEESDLIIGIEDREIRLQSYELGV